MGYNYRELVESLEAIMNETDSIPDAGAESTGSQEEVIQIMKELVDNIANMIDKVKSADGNYQEIIEDLKKARDILADMGYNDNPDVNAATSDDEADVEKVEEDNSYGTEKMAPKTDSEGHRSYKKKGAPSYAARQGFVGM